MARSFGATVVVFSTIVMTIILIRTLGHNNNGSVNPMEVMLVMGLAWFIKQASSALQSRTINTLNYSKNPTRPNWGMHENNTSFDTW
jgi:hypothetical protein